MTTLGWILLDHGVALLSVAAWFAAGVAAALRQARLACIALVVAIVLIPLRIFTVAMLAGAGWWYVQEKVLLSLPILAASGLAAVVVAGRPLVTARRDPSTVVPAGGVVTLLTAAYAALAGLATTLLVGYPLTWGSAMISIALVCLAAVLTARVVTRSGHPSSDGDRPAVGGAEVSRRSVLRIAGGVVAGGLGGAGTAVSLRPDVGHTGHSPSTLSVADLRGARAPGPGGTTVRRVLTAQSATVRLSSGQAVDAWTYNGQAPGPAIVATQGDLIEVTLRNKDIEDGVTLHWHGYDVACGEDGVPGLTQPVVTPGEEFRYRFRADQLGTYWYHTHQASHIGVRKGLYGTLVVHPRVRQERQLDLTLPLHTFGDTLVVADQDGHTDHTAEAGTPVRLRLINTDPDPHRLTLSGTPFRVTAVDGRDLNHPGEISEVGLRLPAGGRYDVEFTMPHSPVVLVADDVVLRIAPDRAAARPEAAPDTAGWPELDLLHYGEPAPAAFDARKADRHFTLVLDRGVAVVDGRPAYAHTVNGRAHPSIPDQLVAEGDLVTFTVVNRSLDTHPWHLHGHPVLVLSRDGVPAAGSPLWVDTFDVRPGQVWTVAFRATNPGIWMNHCHNLPHAHEGMMLRLAYTGVTTPYGDAHAGHG
ncbi:multicopper oxidase type 3 [Kribbella flavida DSM 17836]|uniref:Multicopper oxidase type 3 n=1 Tax=Kribbella flavida (strain DSM 17836 / JCM 10339 / NBRC 14399) TaxID=479435 RepID=D2PQY7_KRIFD|nr:multicopper oxidase family protein [Kribbella flavida]ADB31120.1 multicopper oxidase type 3 [Kribbella flavida DSM 17836]